MNTHLRFILAGTLYLLASAAALRAQTSQYKYTVTDLGPIGTGYVTGINDLGDVIGISIATDVNYHETYHGFVYSGGVMNDVFPGGYTEITSINNSGQAVGMYNDSLGYHHTFLFTPGGGLVETGISSDRNQIDNSGRILGRSIQHFLGTPDFDVTGNLVTYSNGVSTDLGSETRGFAVYTINDHGEFVGNDSHSGAAFLYSSGTLTNLTNAINASQAYSINSFGYVVGSLRGNNRDGFIYNAKTQLASLVPGPNLRGINDIGQTVGHEEHGGGAFLRWNGATQLVSELIPETFVSNLSRSIFRFSGRVINESGQIGATGYVLNADGSINTHHAYLLTQNTPQLPFNLLDLSYIDWNLVHLEKLADNSGTVTAGRGSSIHFNSNLANSGTLTAESGGALMLSGVLTNSGPFSTGHVFANGGTITVQGRTELRGLGEVGLSNGGSIVSVGTYAPLMANQPDELVNVNNTIHGSGSIGDYGLRLINEWKIGTATREELWITLDPRRVSSNIHVIGAQDGGHTTLNTLGGTFDNTGGELRAIGRGARAGDGMIAPATLDLTDTQLIGGIVRAADGGLVRVANSFFGETQSTMQNVQVELQGAGSALELGSDNLGAMGGTLRNISVTGDRSAGQGVRFSGYNFGNAPVLEGVSFLNEVPVTLSSYTQVTLKGTFRNTGTMQIGDPGHPGGGSDTLLAVSGAVSLVGGGAVVLRPFASDGSGFQNANAIDGDPFNGSGTANVLTNRNNIIRGTGVIGGSPYASGALESHMRFVNGALGLLYAAPGDSLTLVSQPGSPIRNEGRLAIDPGGAMSVVGDFEQDLLAFVELGLAGPTPGTGYSRLTVSGHAALDGLLRLTIADSFTPVVGDAFSIVTFGSHSGDFFDYGSSRLAGNLVLEPSFTANALVLTVKERSSGTPAPAQPVTPGAPLAVAPGGTFAGVTATSPLTAEKTMMATLLDGTASASASVTMDFNPAGNFALASGGPLVSDIFNLHGTGSDKFVLQLDYDEAALALGLTEHDLFLAWYDGADWVNAVLGNSDGGTQQDQFFRAYNPAIDFVLGNFGVDTVNDRVWAVVDHNSQFGVASPGTVPEPSSFILALVGGLVVAGLRRRRP